MFCILTDDDSSQVFVTKAMATIQELNLKYWYLSHPRMYPHHRLTVQLLHHRHGLIDSLAAYSRSRVT